jgi:hypothetical protein
LIDDAYMYGVDLSRKGDKLDDQKISLVVFSCSISFCSASASSSLIS